MEIDTAILIRIESAEYMFTKATRVAFREECLVYPKNELAHATAIQFQFLLYSLFEFLRG